jgi:hypothetical protein
MMESTQQIFSRGQIHTCLPAHGTVHLSQDGGGNLNVADASEVDGSSEAGDISNNAPTHSQEQALTIEPMSEESLTEVDDGVHGFSGFACGESQQLRADLACPELILQKFGNQGLNMFVGYDSTGREGPQFLDLGGEISQKTSTYNHLITAVYISCQLQANTFHDLPLRLC